MPSTLGLDHLGLAVSNLDETLSFFVDCLGFEESGRDDSYPRAAVSDGTVRLTLWQVDHDLETRPFHRRRNVGLHHVALRVGSEAELDSIADAVARHPGVDIEFMPEPVGAGPRKHMMCNEPGGIRVEFIWNGD